MKNKTKHIIKTIEPGSIAEELELEPGDELLRVNGEIIEDVFDYHFQTNDTYLELTIRKKDGEEWDLEIEKEYDEEIGITFENEFMDQYRSCSNNCIFCFIDQMPPGMRPTLYFKDDDSRLSFLQGNYITLTMRSTASSKCTFHRSIFRSRQRTRSSAAKCCTTVLRAISFRRSSAFMRRESR